MYKAKRCELNAMTSDAFVTWIETKLEKHGLKAKVIPPDQLIQKNAYNRILYLIPGIVENHAVDVLLRQLGITKSELCDELSREFIRYLSLINYSMELKALIKDWDTIGWNELNQKHVDDIIHVMIENQCYKNRFIQIINNLLTSSAC
jgi:hypothetical protein